MKKVAICSVVVLTAGVAFAALSKDEVKRLHESATILTELRNSPDQAIPERVQPPSSGMQSQGMSSMSADDIKKAKEALKAKGLNPGPIDGTPDSKTQQALREFQQANKIPVTGTLDQQTAEKLGVTIGGSGQKSSTQQRGQDSSVPKAKGGME